MLREISIVWVELGNIRLKRKLEHLIRPTGTSFQEKCDVIFPDRVSHSVMVSLEAIPQSKDKDNPMNVIWWACCLISKNVASYILADAQNVP